MPLAIKRASLPLVGAAIAFTAGCVRYRPAPLIPETAAAALESRALDDPELRAFALSSIGSEGRWPPETWDLDGLTLAAFYFHPDLDVARARWAVARGGVVTAGGRPNPTLHLGPEYVTHTEAPSPWILGLSLDIPVETLHKRGYRVSQARALAESARLAIASVAWQVRGRLRSALLDLWMAEGRAQLVRRELALREEIVAMLERRLEVGEAGRPDVTRERISAERLQVSARDIARQAATARARVAGAIGIPLQALDGRTLALSTFDSVPAEEDLAGALVRHAALLGRADVRALLAEYAAAQAALQLEVARQYPDVQLGPGYTFELGENRFAFALGVALPVFNRNRGPIVEAEARRSETAARFTALQARVLATADHAVEDERAAAQAIRAAEAALGDQRRAAEQIAARFKAGEADRLDLRTAELEVVSGEQSRLEAMSAQRQAVGALEDALQRPLFGSAHPLPGVESSPRAAERHGP